MDNADCCCGKGFDNRLWASSDGTDFKTVCHNWPTCSLVYEAQICRCHNCPSWFMWPKFANTITGPGVVWFIWPRYLNATSGMIVVWFMWCWSLHEPPLANNIWDTKGQSFFVVTKPISSALCGPELGQYFYKFVVKDI